jgi:hypothetical protein
MPRTTLESPRRSRATVGSPAAALASVMTHAGINPRHEAADLQEALQRAIALHRYSCFGTTLEEALAWCLAWVQTRDPRLP